MMTMPVPGPSQPAPVDKTVPYYVAGLMLLGLAGLIAIGVIVGKSRVEL